MDKNQIETLKKMLSVSALMLLLSSFLYFVDVKSFLYRASVLNLPNHEPFDGTVYPIEKAPDFVNLTESERTANFSDLPSEKIVDAPFYDADVLRISSDSLNWGNGEHNKIRNAKIFYSVPYMGNYKLDGKEYAGSHPAVDIKTNVGTPVHAVANGVVTKVSNISSGFGHHVVVMHNNVPTLANANQTETLYSNYAHLSDIEVNVGDVVTKGQVIAYSGNTGTSTTPHLHFQIDNDEAPWHPYWPFTWKDAEDAGVSYWNAINVGLGKEEAMKTTIHPLEYVQKYMDSSNVPDTSYVNVVEERSDEVEEDEKDYEVIVEERSDEVNLEVKEVEEVVEVEEPKTPSYEEVVEERQLKLRVDVESTYTADEEVEVRVYLEDQNGQPFPASFTGEMELRSASGNFSVKPALVKSSDFGKDGVLDARLKNFSPGSDRVVVKTDDLEYTSRKFSIVDEDLVFSDVLPASRYFKALTDLKARGIIKGYGDGTYKPSQTLSKVEAAKFIVLAADLDVLPSPYKYPFADAARDGWYKDYVYTLYNAGVITGDDRGKLDPNKEVNVAEFLKMLLTALDVEVEEKGNGPWYGPYVDEAVKMNIIERDEFGPADKMTRGEVADAIYKLLQYLEA